MDPLLLFYILFIMMHQYTHIFSVACIAFITTREERRKMKIQLKNGRKVMEGRKRGKAKQSSLKSKYSILRSFMLIIAFSALNYFMWHFVSMLKLCLLKTLMWYMRKE